MRLREAIGLAALEAELITGRDCSALSLPKIRFIIARAEARRAEDRLFLASALGLAAGVPYAKSAADSLNRLLGDLRDEAGQAEPEPAEFAGELAAFFGAAGINCDN